MSQSSNMEFGHIRRMKDIRFPHEVAVILPGEYFLSETPMVVYTVLGSCISVCLRDPQAGIGGMNHFMLAAPKGQHDNDAWSESGRYGSYAMEMLINGILSRGGHRKRLEAKVFGGGKIYDGSLDVGAKNAAWALDYLQQEGMPPVKADVGDVCPRKVYYFTDTGKVLMKKLDRVQSQKIVQQERQYESTLKKEPAAGEVTLF
ncbi:chemoreceptor glutamine deamidase CheD [Nitrospira sp. M1]